MFRASTTAALSLVLAIALTSPAGAELIEKRSAHDVTTTLDRLEQVLRDNGIRILARVDHAANAESVGLDLRPTQLLIFGRPEAGTVLMQETQRVGLDLPMRVVVWEDADGVVTLSYVTVDELAGRYGIDPTHEVVQGLNQGLGNLTDAAVAE